MKRDLLKLGGFGAAVHASNVAVLLATTALLSHQLGVTAFGEYVLVLTVVILSGVVTVFGLPTFLTRELAGRLAEGAETEHSFTPGRLVRNAILTSLALFFLVGAALETIRFLRPEFWPGSIGLAPLGVILGRAILEIFAGSLVGLGRIRLGQFSMMLLMNAPFLVLLAVFSFLWPNVLNVKLVFQLHLAGIWFGATLAAYWTWRGLREYQNLKGPNLSWLVALRACVPLTLVNGIASLQQNLVFLILGLFLSPAEVGIFRVAERVSQLSQFLRAALLNVLQPRVSKSWKDGTLPQLQPVLRKVSLTNTLFNLGLLALVAAIGGPLLKIAFGSGMEAAYAPLLILLLGYGAAAVFGFGGMVLAMTSHAGHLFWVLAVTFALLVVLLFFLPGILGTTGAAAATAVYSVLTTFALWYTARKRVGVSVSFLSGIRR